MINRRTVLRGLGITLALPALEVMSRDIEASDQKMSKAGRTCKRLATFHVPFGVVMDQWHPTKHGYDYIMPQSLKPMERNRNDFTCFSNLQHGVVGGHSACVTFMSGIKPALKAGFQDGNITVDQRIVEIVGHETRYSSFRRSSGQTHPVPT